MRVLVTGATSLLGRATVSRLRERGDQVAGFQRRPGGLGVAEHLGDVTDRGAVALALEGIETVVHLAARVSATGPWSAFEATNVTGTRNLVDSARDVGVARFVHVSSPAVAHGGKSLVGAPAGPAVPAHVRGHYAQSKARAELVALEANTPSMAVVAILTEVAAIAMVATIEPT